MRGSKKTIIILLAVLVALIGVWQGLRVYNQKQEAREEEESVVSMDMGLGELVSVSYTNSSGDIELTKDEDGRWVLADAGDVSLAEDTVDMLVAAVTDPLLDREIGEPDDLADYGLEEASYVIALTDEDGNEITLSVGDAADNGGYYIKNSVSESVYTTGDTEILTYLEYAAVDLVENDTVPDIGTAQVQQITVETSEGAQTYTGDENEDEIGTILGGLGALSFDSCVDYNVTSAEALAEYGLDEETRATVTITYTVSNEDSDEETAEESAEEAEESEGTQSAAVFTIYVGGVDEEADTTYLMIEGSTLVNEASTSTVSNLMNQKDEETEE